MTASSTPMAGSDVGRDSPANRDCLAKARPGEPMFIILGRDPDGGNIVRLWAERRKVAGDPEHAGPVFAIADAMDEYASHFANRPDSAPGEVSYPPMVNAELLEALTATARELQVERDCLFSSCTVANDPDTLDDDAKPDIARMDAALTLARAAIHKATANPIDTLPLGEGK